ncbi:MAG TPA: permease, partial [Psychromonas hadalis]|nr:permease [Psychromonas hadalis]
MFEIFTTLASFISFNLLKLTPDTPIANSVHFFIEDTTKILVLLTVLIYFIAYVRANLNPERVRFYLQGKKKSVGYFLGSIFGAITPFCSCSSIPLFMGFVSARIPIGITVAFLLTSPLINEVVVIMLAGILGIKFTVMYVTLGIILGMLGGILVDLFKGERFLHPFLAKMYTQEAGAGAQALEPVKLTPKERHEFAKTEMQSILKRIWKWVFIGVGIGALIHGLVPQEWFATYFNDGQWWTVPMASLLSIPMYINASGAVPIMESLLLK